ncbi:MAG: hypothetical protein CMO35_11685 [Verrucomicrobiaceae bacterium]|nr:hypothetical protein [Verrucomicrobiaceae bacterium]
MNAPVKSAAIEILRSEKGALAAHIQFELVDSNYEGVTATAKLELKTVVNDGRPVHDTGTLGMTTFKVLSGANQVKIPLMGHFPYEYVGEQIRNDLYLQLDLGKRGLFRKKPERVDLVIKPPEKPVASGGEDIVEPDDEFSLVRNLRALSGSDRIITIGLLLVAGIIIGINTLIGVHDQFSPEYQTILYSHHDDGLPLGQAGGVDALIATGMWWAIRKRLRRYMEFHVGPRLTGVWRRLRGESGRITKTTSIQVGDVVRGRSRVALEQATLRIVACNMECGQYVRGSGSNQRTVSFSTPVRSMILYEKTIPAIPAGTPLHTCFEESIELAPLFARLYPPCMASETHGLKLYWEAQLIHPDFVDQELVLPTTFFAVEDFF